MEKVYKLFKYTLAHDRSELCLEDHSEHEVAMKAFELSEEAGEDWAFRMERWEDGKMAGGWRFFQNGKEFTDWIKKAVRETVENLEKQQ